MKVLSREDARKLFADSGLAIRAIQKNPAVYPVLGCIVLGTALAIGYTLRLAIKCPDVTWNSRKNTEPWQEYANKNYKFFIAEDFDIKKYKHPRPEF